MDITSLLPMLIKLLGGSQQPTQQPAQAPIPDSVINSYPNGYIDTTAATTVQQTLSQEPLSNGVNLDKILSMLGGQNNSGNILQSLMPLLSKTQKNNSPKISELKSVDEYIFD